MKDNINIFNVESKRLIENRKSKRIFFENNIYSDEVEKILAKKLETPFAKLIDNKILNKQQIELTRSELLLIKKFILVDSIRTLRADGFVKKMKEFSMNASRHVAYTEFEKLLLEAIHSINDINESNYTIFNNSIYLILEIDDLTKISSHPYLYKEFYLWSKAFMDGYISFWDSHPDQEYLLTDNGMTTEYEPSHIIYEGLSLSKLSYLLYSLKEVKDKERKSVYANLLSKHSFFYENFNVFNLSSTRCIALIHPFFRLFSKNSFVLKESNIYKPDIWPSFIETKRIFSVPLNKYVRIGEFSKDDKFIYKPKQMSRFDTIYINILLLSCASKIIGFISIDKIADSLMSYILLKSVNNKDIYTNNLYANSKNLIKHIINDEFQYVFKHYKKDIFLTNVFPYEFIAHYSKVALRDTKHNKYLLRYLLENENKVRTMRNFDFMGDPNQRVVLLKMLYENASKGKKLLNKNV